MHCRWLIVYALLIGVAPAAAQSVSDSVAMRIVIASGGQDAWDAVSFLRFNVRLYRERELVYVIQHLWDKKEGQYRMEVPGPNDEPYVAVFDPDDFKGSVYWNGYELFEKDARTLMETVRTRYYHDLFFMIAPFLLLDSGVTTRYLADVSSQEEAVIEVTIPYWKVLPSKVFRFHADRQTGRLARIAYPLPSGEMRTYLWQRYQDYDSEVGTLSFATRKRAEGHPFVIETGHISMPPSVGSKLFSSPTPVLQSISKEEESKDPPDGG